MVTAGAREAEINLTLLMWGLELSIKPDAFGARRAVVKLTFADQPEGTRHWWFINEDGRAELCVQKPGFEVDLYLVTTLPYMIYIYRGDLPLARALEQGRLEAQGAAWARRALARWLARSSLADVKSERADAPAATRRSGTPPRSTTVKEGPSKKARRDRLIDEEPIDGPGALRAGLRSAPHEKAAARRFESRRKAWSFRSGWPTREAR